MKVVLLGLPFFARKTARLLSEQSNGADRFVALDTTSRRDRARYLLELPSADCVLCCWGTLTKARTLDLALALRKRVVHYWLGTDVLVAADAVRNGEARSRYVERFDHLCEAPWTRDELAAVGVEAEVVPVAAMGSVAPAQEASSDPTEFSVLGYVGRGRADFYRLGDFVRLARDFPELRFRVAGTDGDGAEVPDNLRLLGWDDDPYELYRDCAVFVRIPEHDGYSYSIREALAWGRHVIASYPYPHCHHATDYAALRDGLAALRTRFEAGRLTANAAGRHFVLRTFDEAKVADGLRRILAGAR